ncbi:Sulfotransferase family protein [Roseovarius nanhaiticus]|uniref:Sulfotransferase family protein n=1 Tax=Roseovarius nanhaiticus TaxID=573024 RepID=A0A1N7FMW0_9RHOB|nr:sulfotransferase family 2 domain-containing protein [Roseovarius nanhaiticus]SEK50513.1 Sulfotransferase family protein [Roseovarius nanhaiticus]SIS01633.1 Sulfotransferase family protein [Roseovarius nanhaiticus]
MIISPGRNYVFVHIPKTGGSSLATALEGRAMRDDILIGDTPKARKRRGRLKDLAPAGRLWKHSTLADIDGIMPSDWMQNALVFTLVRNPWDRLVSYYHWLRAQSFDHPAVTAARDVGFDAFLARPDIQASIRANPYTRYVYQPPPARAPLFIRLEQFSKDAAPLWEHLGFELDLPRVNTSERAADYTQYYDDTTRGIVESICAEDIARFGYRYGSSLRKQ